ncbi:uncharacterized protein LOC108926879 isoform X1 [Arapaima gigas]
MEGKLSKYTYLLIIVTDVTCGLLTYGRLNGDITLTAALPAGFEEILWTHNSDKVVEFVKGGGMREFSKFRGRTTVNQETGELTVRNLQETDSGRFTAEVLVAGRLQNSVFDVKVVDAVRRPTVRCEQRDAVGILRCHSEGEMRQYRWEGPRNFSASWSDEPIGLEISSSDSVYSCVVKNPVSEERSEAFRAQDCFTGRSSHGGALVAAAAVIAAAVTAAVCSLVLGVYCVRRRDRLTAASFLMPSDGGENDRFSGREDERKREMEEPEERTCSTRSATLRSASLRQPPPAEVAAEGEGAAESSGGHPGSPDASRTVPPPLQKLRESVGVSGTPQVEHLLRRPWALCVFCWSSQRFLQVKQLKPSMD